MPRTVYGLKIPTIKEFWNLVKDTTSEFSNDNGIKLSAALAYYTIFSIPPLLVIIIRTTGIVFGEEAIQGQIYSQIQGFVGKDAAAQIQQTITATVFDRNTFWATSVSIIALLFGATGVFAEIQDSINIIWGLKAKPQRGFFKLVINRLISFSMIVTIGFILLVSLMLNAVMDLFSARLQRLFPDVAVYTIYAFNIILLLVVITLLFATIFKILPDARIRWRIVIFGALFTTILFMIGKVLISLYLGNSDIGSAYGAAGSLIVILVWVYYSSMILFFGAEFTQVYADKFSTGIEPNEYAVFIKHIEKELPKEISPTIK